MTGANNNEEAGPSSTPRRSTRISAADKGKNRAANVTDQEDNHSVDHNQDSDSNNNEPPYQNNSNNQNNNSGNPPLSLFGNINTQELSETSILRLLKAVQSHASMPIPSSDQAPRFRGNNLKRFLEDYNIAAEGAGWSDEQKCENLHSYCGHHTREIVKKLPERKRLDWGATKQRLIELYVAEERSD